MFFSFSILLCFSMLLSFLSYLFTCFFNCLFVGVAKKLNKSRLEFYLSQLLASSFNFSNSKIHSHQLAETLTTCLNYLFQIIPLSAFAVYSHFFYFSLSHSRLSFVSINQSFSLSFSLSLFTHTNRHPFYLFSFSEISILIDDLSIGLLLGDVNIADVK